MRIRKFILLFFLSLTVVSKALADDSVLELTATPISLAQAEGLFTYFEKLSEIPFAYVKDGCYARAHLISKILDEHGIVSLKIFAIPRDRTSYFPVVTPNGTAKWSYHVASVLRVKRDSEFELMVFDPSLFDHIVPVKEWLSFLRKDMPNDFILDSFLRTRFTFELVSARNEPNKLEIPENMYSWNQDDLKTTHKLLKEFWQKQKSFEMHQ